MNNKQWLACDLLSGHGGLSVAEAQKLAGIKDIEIKDLKTKTEKDMSKKTKKIDIS